MDQSVSHLTVYNFRLFCIWMPMSGHAHCRFVILRSGQGTNMQAIVAASKLKTSKADVVLVVSSRADAPGLNWARAQGVVTRAVAHADYPSREAFDSALMRTIDEFEPDYVLLAGFMRVLTPAFVQRYAGRLVNIHPSLLPAFPGLHTHQQALSKGVQVHGCTVHFVTPVLDNGPVIAQGVVAVHPDDTEQSLAARVLKIEHDIYPQVCEWLAEGRVKLTPDNRVEVLGVKQRSFFGTHLE